MRLSRVGIDRTIGFVRGGIAAWTAARMPLAAVPQISPEALAERVRAGLRLIDVRRQPEWSVGHVIGALHFPLNRFLNSIDELDRSQTVGVYCKSGYRSAIASSLLQRPASRTSSIWPGATTHGARPACKQM